MRAVLLRCRQCRLHRDRLLLLESGLGARELAWGGRHGNLRLAHGESDTVLSEEPRTSICARSSTSMTVTHRPTCHDGAPTCSRASASAQGAPHDLRASCSRARDRHQSACCTAAARRDPYMMALPRERHPAASALVSLQQAIPPRPGRLRRRSCLMSVTGCCSSPSVAAAEDRCRSARSRCAPSSNEGAAACVRRAAAAAAQQSLSSSTAAGSDGGGGACRPAVHAAAGHRAR